MHPSIRGACQFPRGKILKGKVSRILKLQRFRTPANVKRSAKQFAQLATRIPVRDPLRLKTECKRKQGANSLARQAQWPRGHCSSSSFRELVLHPVAPEYPQKLLIVPADRYGFANFPFCGGTPFLNGLTRQNWFTRCQLGGYRDACFLTDFIVLR